MAWSTTAIRDMARDMAAYDAQESEVTDSHAQRAFERFAIESQAIYVAEPISITALAVRYPLARVHVIEQVIYDGAELNRFRHPWERGWTQVGSELVVSFEPGGTPPCTVKGFGVPATVGDCLLQPEQALMEAVASLCAATFLRRYTDDAQTRRRMECLAHYESVMKSLRRRKLNASVERGPGRVSSGVHQIG